MKKKPNFTFISFFFFFEKRYFFLFLFEIFSENLEAENMVFVQCNKLSVNAEKIKFTRERDNITLALQTLRINNIFVINNTLVK